MAHVHTRMHTRRHAQDTLYTTCTGVRSSVCRRMHDAVCLCVATLRVCVCVRAAIEPPDYPPQFDLMRYAAMREKVNYAVNERLNIYTLRGVGMVPAKRGSFGSRSSSIVEFGYGRRTPENGAPFPSRFKLIALQRSRSVFKRLAQSAKTRCFLIASKLIWNPRSRFMFAYKSDRYKYAYETTRPGVTRPFSEFRCSGSNVERWV